MKFIVLEVVFVIRMGDEEIMSSTFFEHSVELFDSERKACLIFYLQSLIESK